MPRSYADALFRVGDTLQRGLAGIGQAKREDAEIGLMRRKAEFDIGRQEKADTRAEEVYQMQRPGLELANSQARAQQEAFNQPLNVKGAFGSLSLPAMESGVDNEIASYLGAKVDPNGNYVDAQGKPITQGYLQASGKMQGVTDILLSKLDAATAQQDMLEDLREQIAGGAFQGEDLARAKNQSAFMEKLLTDPDRQAIILGEQRKAAIRLGDEKSAARVDAQIEALRKAKESRAKEERGYSHEMGLARLREAGDWGRTKMLYNYREEQGKDQGRKEHTKAIEDVAKLFAKTTSQDGREVVDPARVAFLSDLATRLPIERNDVLVAMAKMASSLDDSINKYVKAGRSDEEARRQAEIDVRANFLSMFSGAKDETAPAQGQPMGQSPTPAQGTGAQSVGAPALVRATAPRETKTTKQLDEYSGETEWTENTTQSKINKVIGEFMGGMSSGISATWNDFLAWARRGTNLDAKKILQDKALLLNAEQVFRSKQRH